ncbi:MAG: RNA methyltransferase [Candidatus Omnitrophota bacterium]
MLLYGKNSVRERLKTNPASVKKIFLQDNFAQADIIELIDLNKIAIERLPSHRLRRIKRADNLGGIVARIDEFAYLPFDRLLDLSQDKKPTIIFLDRICDPQNLGSIMRTAACLGGLSLVIPESKACRVNETVLHVAAGGENYISVSVVSNMLKAVLAAKDCGYWIAGAALGGGVRQDIRNVSLPFPLGVVLGSEGFGIRCGIDKHLDIKVHIPMEGRGLSFNVNIACAIVCYEIFRQGRGDR